MVVTRYECGNGDGMFEHKKGSYVDYEEFEKLKRYSEELFEIAYDNCKGLSHDDLMEIVKKYK